MTARRRPLSGALTAALSLALLAGAVAQPVLADDLLDRDVVYGHKMGMALTYDVVKPEKPNGAGVLFMVSGGWVSRWFDPEIAMKNQGSFTELIERGFTLFLVRHGSSPMFKVPEAVVDVRKALTHIRANAADWSVDKNRLGVFGGSAGGHLSLMLGTASESEVGKHGTAGDSRVAAVVAYFPPVDLQEITGPNDRFPALDFDAELADDISPVLYVSGDDPPTLLVHGTEDTLVPLANSERIHKAFKEKGVTTDIVVIEGAGHGFRGEHDDMATKALVDWFETHLGTGAASSSGAGR